MPSSRSSSRADVEKTPPEIYAQGATLDDPDAEFGGHDARQQLERKLVRKIDIRMSILTVIYILNYIDRNNAGAARARGLETDLQLHDQQFPTLLSILYVGYIFMQIPSNMLLNYIGKPSLYLPAAMMIWGTISILTGIATNFVGALLTRFFLGFVEAAFLPGALFLLSKWYKRSELGTRTAVLYCGNIISNAFGALIASGILDGMDGKLGRAAWRWLFYIEGSLTVFVAICAIFILPDFPTTTRWLTDGERRLALKRMQEDAGVGDEGETETGGLAHGLLLAFKDWKVWWMSLAMASQVIALSFNAYFPTLTATLGFNPTVTLLLCAPPFVFTAIMAFVVSRHSDAVGERFYHITVPIFIGVIGFVIAICTMNTGARYFSLFLMAQSYAGFTVLYTWVSNSFPRPPSKRAVAVALVNAFSQLGNIAGSYVWPKEWGPTYRNSYAICISCAGCMIAMCYIFKLHLAHLNRELEREEAEKGTQEKGFRGLAHGLWLAVKDWKVWWIGLAMVNQVIALSFNAYFPTLTATLGFNPTVTLLLCAPPFIFAAVITFMLSRHSDATGERFYHIAVPVSIGVIGFVIAMCTTNTGARYFSLLPLCATWVSNSFPRPPSKRAVAIALLNAFSQLGNIAGWYLWLKEWGPSYRNSFAICASCAGGMVIMYYIFKLHLAHLNRKLENEEVEKDVKEKGFRYLL